MSRRCGSSKPTPTPLNGLAIKPGKTRRKLIEGNADTIIGQTSRQKPAAYCQCGGGARQKGAMARQTTVKTLPRTVSVARGGETKKGELKENIGAKTEETNIKTLPQATIVEGGVRQKAKTNTKWKGGTTHSPVRGGEVASRKRISKEKTKQRASQIREYKTYSLSLIHISEPTRPY